MTVSQNNKKKTEQVIPDVTEQQMRNALFALIQVAHYVIFNYAQQHYPPSKLDQDEISKNSRPTS